MKLNIKKSKPSGLASLTGPAPSTSSGPGWAMTSADQYKSAAKTAKAMSTRAPEIWVKPGERMELRFRSAEPVVSFEAYRFKDRSGKWQKAIRPEPGKTDRFAERGMRAQRLFVYEVNDLKGYKDRTGKSKKFIPRFYVVGVKQFEQLSLIAETQGMPLTKYNITVAREGAGTDTTYMLLPGSPSPMPEEVKRAERLRWEDFYKPLPTSVQDALLGGYSPSDDED
jgi:hypothetical protein